MSAYASDGIPPHLNSTHELDASLFPMSNALAAELRQQRLPTGTADLARMSDEQLQAEIAALRAKSLEEGPHNASGPAALSGAPLTQEQPLILSEQSLNGNDASLHGDPCSLSMHIGLDPSALASDPHTAVVSQEQHLLEIELRKEALEAVLGRK